VRRFVIGDIHGAHKALLQCLERSKFDSKKDVLISLGDVCDGWPEVNKVFNELMQLKNFKTILGNHDEWSLRWMKDGWEGYEWTSQGGKETIASYNGNRINVPASHVNLLKKAPLYIEIDKKLFVHSGINPGIAMNKQDSELLMWDRDLLYDAVRIDKTKPNQKFGKWDDIFIGHTTTQCYHTLEPIHACNIWAIDTGGGWNGKLTIMDIDSHEYWQSDLLPTLYPNIPGRHIK